jgi:G6PDH family F420-dependent oxidoreductase
LGTGVTCPLLRIHPAVIAQAAATLGSMARGRFFLGVGTGENLNEHIIGEHWPPASERLEMLEEAVDLMRTLWEGGLKSYRGHYYTVENARLYTLPEEPVRVYVAANGEESAQLAGEIGDGLIAVSPDADLVRNFELEGGSGKPRLGQVAVCWAEDEARARRTARELWPISGIAASLKTELPLPVHFEDASQKVTEDDIAQRIPCGPDAQRHIDAIEKFANAGFDHIYVHQIGDDQEGFFRFYQREILPRLAQHPARLASETPGRQAA